MATLDVRRLVFQYFCLDEDSVGGILHFGTLEGVEPRGDYPGGGTVKSFYACRLILVDQRGRFVAVYGIPGLSVKQDDYSVDGGALIDEVFVLNVLHIGEIHPVRPVQLLSGLDRCRDGPFDAHAFLLEVDHNIVER